MKVLVTGASSSIALSVIRLLLEKKIEVIATSRNEAKFREAAKHMPLHYVPYDLSVPNEDDLFGFFGRPDHVIHLAWDKLSMHTSEEHLTQVLPAHRSFLSNLMRNGLRNLTVAGTAYEYGLQEGERLETDLPLPVVAYGIAKDMLRRFLAEESAKYGCQIRWVRIFNVFSPGREGGNLFSSLIKAVEAGEKTFNMSGGEQVRDYLTAEEVAERLVAIALHPHASGIYHCCSGNPVMLKDLVSKFIADKQYDINLNLGYYPYLAHEPMQQWGSTRKLRTVFGDQ